MFMKGIGGGMCKALKFFGILAHAFRLPKNAFESSGIGKTVKAPPRRARRCQARSSWCKCRRTGGYADRAETAFSWARSLECGGLWKWGCCGE